MSWKKPFWSFDANSIINGIVAFLMSNDIVKMQHDYSHHVMPLISSRVPLHSLGQANQNEVQHNLFGYVMPLALALGSSDTVGIISGITAFLRS